MLASEIKFQRRNKQFVEDLISKKKTLSEFAVNFQSKSIFF